MANSENGSTEEKKPKKRGFNFKVYIPLTLIVLIVAGVGYIWYNKYLKYITTDDAYIESDMVSVCPKIPGRIIKIYADEGDTVKKGTLLVDMDSTELAAQRMHAIALKNQSESMVIQAEANLNTGRDKIKIARIAMESAKNDLDRADEQFKGKVIPKERHDHIKTAFEEAKARLEAAESAMKVMLANVKNSKLSIKTAESQIEVLEKQLQNMHIYAPMNGVIAKRWLLPGDMAQPGQSVFTITNNEIHWVEVNLEETKLAEIHQGQKAKFTVDAIPDVTFRGKIISIGSNTSGKFSLIPPNNASGNFTKVTQRIPVKISIESTDGGKDPDSYQLLSGMSVVVDIIKDNN